MADPIPLTLPGFEGRGLSLRPAGLVAGATILCDGAPAPRQGRAFTLKNNAGEPVTMRLTGNLFELRVDAGGQILRPFPPMPWWGYVLALAPFSLVVIGGLIGGVAGAVGAVTNIQILRTQQPAGLKVLYCLLVIAGVTIAYFVFAVVFAIGFGLATH